MINEGKPRDPNARRFIADHPAIHEAAGLAPGVPVQVELDAVEPLTLRQMYQDELDHWWDDDAYQASLEREAADLAELRERIE